jgi:uncharacterized protein YcfL
MGMRHILAFSLVALALAACGPTPQVSTYRETVTTTQTPVVAAPVVQDSSTTTTVRKGY